MTTENRSADIVIAGAGMAGLVAAAMASERGAEVVVIEKGSSPGGSMILSGGGIWTYESAEHANEVAPWGDAELQSLIVNRLADALDWLEAVGVSLTPLKNDDGWGMETDPEELTATLVTAVERTGGIIYTDAPLSELVLDDGSVEGVWIRDGVSRDRIDGSAVILATGGFSGNSELIERHISDRTDRLWLRANPHSTGDGLLAARDAGAKTSAGFGWFYGHNMAAPPAHVSPEQFVELTQYYGPRAMAVDAAGNRFVDEAACVDESELSVATAKHAGGQAYYVLDDELYESWFSEKLHIGTMVDRAAEGGGRVASADSLAAIPAAVDDWPLNGASLQATLREFNAACRGERWVNPPTSRNSPLDASPFRIVAVQPGITMSTGGLAVDTTMRIYSRSGSDSSLPRGLPPDGSDRATPIPGLFAAGAEVGNVHNGGYLGGLATALVTGRIAGHVAADEVA